MAFIKSRHALNKVRGNNKILIWVLAIVLAGIWGEVGYWLIWGGGSSDEEVSKGLKSVAGQTSGTEDSFIFTADVRDPFAYRPDIQIAKRIFKPDVQIWVPPPLKLEGVIIKPALKRDSGKGSAKHLGERVAIIESLDGKTFFESPGDTLYGVKILSIENELVKYRYGKKDTSWAIGK